MYTTLLKSMSWFCLVIALFALLGCETESSEQIAISITPNTATLSPGESQEFVASGWQDYTWSIRETDRERGVLSTSKGDRTVYTAVSGTNDIVVLTLEANVRTTNTTSSGGSRVSAEALITHQP